MFRTASVIAIGLAFAPPAWGGHERGNTADYGNPESGSAWFLGKNMTVTYCVDIHEEAGIALPEVLASIEQSLGLWKSYIGSKKVHFDQEDHLQLATRFEYKEESPCDESRDLRFLVGHPKEHRTIAPILEHMDHWNPLGLAHRQQYDVYTGWGKGFIWIASEGSVFSGRRFPQWSVSNAFTGVLLHEFGHVFGVGHIKDTIMDNERLHTTVVAATFHEGAERQKASSRLAEIDWNREVYSVEFTELSIPGEMYQIELYKARAEQAFEHLMGRLPEGSMTITLRRKEWKYELDLGDGIGKRLFPLQDLEQDGGYSPTFFDSVNAFKIYGPMKPGLASLMGTRYSPSGMTTVSSLITTRGESLVVLIKRAMDSRLWQIDYISNGVVRPLFYSIQ